MVGGVSIDEISEKGNITPSKSIEEIIKNARWKNLKVGDIVEFYGGKKYMYYGLNQEGGPGNEGNPEPMFSTEKPESPQTFFFIRKLKKYSSFIYEEGNSQIYFGGVARASWINTSKYHKIGHIETEEWNKMVNELRSEVMKKQ